ncbi:MAG: 3-hydroxyacyl-CoA dehydrogenase, partial [Proteobacteria bacterium]
MQNKAEGIATELARRIAIVTGAGGGLGRSHALLLARLGAKVLVNDVAEDAAEQVAREIRESGGDALGFAASVTGEASAAA